MTGFRFPAQFPARFPAQLPAGRPRRTAVIAGGAVVALAAFLPRAAAQDKKRKVGRLEFTTPDLTEADVGLLGRGWDWVGLDGPTRGPRLAVAVNDGILAASAQQVLGILLVPGMAGALPEVKVSDVVVRTVAGATDCVSARLAYGSGRQRLSGTVLCGSKGGTGFVLLAVGTTVGQAVLDEIINSVRLA